MIKHMTKNCVVCGKRAKIFTGYVISRNGEKIIAGWCGRHCNSGYVGRWKREDGMMPWEELDTSGGIPEGDDCCLIRKGHVGPLYLSSSITRGRYRL